jgi:hypothetical protein
MVVRYDGVALLDQADEAFGRSLGGLQAGDEVEVLERAGAWAQVRTAQGRSGWVPSMTLKDPTEVPDISRPIEAQPAAYGAPDEAIPLEALLEAARARRREQEVADKATEAARTRSRGGRARRAARGS